MASDWDEKTPPESLSAMRAAINANTDTARAAADWASRTYHLVEPIVQRQDALEKRVKRIETTRHWPTLLAASVAIALSAVGIACEVIR